MGNDTEARLKLKECRKLEISAASGLLLIDDEFFCIADDDRFLFQFKSSNDDLTERTVLFSEQLPTDARKLKRVKPDLESLMQIAEYEGILAIPSGSEANRSRGAMIVGKNAVTVDFFELFNHLRTLQPDLNIEGAIDWQEDLLLFSRGNGASKMNFIFQLDKKIFLQELANIKVLSDKSLKGQHPCDLGYIDNHPLGFTDAAFELSHESEPRIWYLAVAETGLSTYEDGDFAGAVLGCLDRDFKTIYQQRLEISEKPEGLALDLSRKKFFVVTDADNHKIKSKLWIGELPLVSRP